MKLHAEQVVADYQRLGTLAKVAALHRRSSQAIWKVLKKRGLTKPRVVLPFVTYRGEKFTKHRGNGYYRATRTGTQYRYLHRVMWEDAYGPVPAGREIVFEDGDRGNVVLENLLCLTRNRARQRGYAANAWTVFRREWERLNAAATEALDAADPVALKSALDALDALPRPKQASEASKERTRVNSLRMWAAMDDRQRAERVQQCGQGRRRARERKP